MKAVKSVTFSKNLFQTFQKSVVRKQHNIVMGIETSFDDTGCAIMDSSGKILGESTNSQTKIHTEMGGVMPTLARELHEENISSVVNQTLKNANMTVNDIDAVAVTTKPGLKGSLYVGTNYGIQLCRDFNKPFIPIHHMQAHALTARITHKVEFPFLILLISGAHCILSVAETPVKFQLLGSSVNDAPGEAMDKIARRMKLRLLPEFRNCCGGEALEKSAAKGNPEAIPLTVPLLQKRDCNFSFSGIKTAASIYIEKQEEKYSIVGSSLIPDVHNLSASVLHTITKHLVQRVQRSMLFVSMKNIIPPEKQTLVVSGGVACNNYIKRGLEILTNETGYKLIVPPPKFCTDNGVMIAWNGIEKLRLQHDVIPPTELDSIEVEAKSPIGDDITEAVAAASIKVKTIKLHSLYRKNSDEENIKKAVSK